MPESFTSRGGTVGKFATNAPDDFDLETDDEGFYPVSRLRQQYVDYLTAKVLEYEEQKQGRHYYHGAQYTPREAQILRDRRQPIITFNRINRKIDSIVGLLQRLRQDPKAYPRNPKNADGAEIATQCVQAVLEASDWDFIEPYCAGQAATEGIAGIELKLIDGDHGDPDIAIDFIFGDDFFYDPRSFKPDFSDAQFMGIAKWLDLDKAIELFPDKEDELRTLMTEAGFDLTTHSDREYKWVYVNEKRVRLVEHWYRHKGKWYWAFYSSRILLDQGPSEFLDQRGHPMNRFIMFSAMVDHDGDRYGFTRNLKGPQDELNQRRSKALFMSNVTRLIAQKGAIDNVEVARREYARPDGFVEYNAGYQPPTPDQQGQDISQQLSLMQDARMEIDSFANIMPDVLRTDDSTEHSGVALNLLQKAGIAELGSFLRNHKSWKKRVYKAIWNILVRVWQSERFVRVTDNEGLAQFFQVNAVEIDPQTGQSTLINAIGALDVEMDLDDGPDEASIMQDAYDVLKGYPAGVIPPQVLIELSPLSSKVKQRVLQQLQQPPDPMQLAAKQIMLQGAAADVEETHADIENKRAQAMERRTRSVTDVARAAHLGHQAGLDTATFLQGGAQQQAAQVDAAMHQGPGPSSPGGMPGQPTGPIPPGPGPSPFPGSPGGRMPGIPSYVPTAPPPSQVFGRFSGPPGR